MCLIYNAKCEIFSRCLLCRETRVHVVQEPTNQLVAQAYCRNSNIIILTLLGTFLNFFASQHAF